MANFTAAQTKQLLAPINPVRVLKDGKGNAHLPQQDVLAHLNRIFGFGSFDYELLSSELTFEQQHIKRDGSKPDGRYDVCYRVTMRLTIRDSNGETICRYEDGSTGSSSNQTRGDGHDLAFKSGISLAKKRCAIALGDQFGLSLYSKGSTNALVGGTLVMPGEDEVEKDVQKDVPQAVSMGIDEIERPLDGSDDEPSAPATTPNAAPKTDPHAKPQGGLAGMQNRMASAPKTLDAGEIDALLDRINATNDITELGGIWTQAADLPDVEKGNVRAITEARVAALKAATPQAA